MEWDPAKIENIIKAGDVPALDVELNRYPEIMDSVFSFNGGENGGYLLNCAAFYNQPAIIGFLAQEKGLDVNKNTAISGAWTPLRHAKTKEAYQAAAMLLLLKADPKIVDSDGNDTVAFCASPQVQEAKERVLNYLRPVDKEMYFEKKKKALEEAQKKYEGVWRAETSQQITHDYQIPGKNLSITELFNFATRIWRSFTLDADNKLVGQETRFFDDIPDKTFLSDACRRLNEQGGEADENAVYSRSVIKAGPYIGPKK